MDSDLIRRRIVRRILCNDKKVKTLLDLFIAMESKDEKMRREIAETIAEILYPKGIARIAEVIHPNGMIS